MARATAETIAKWMTEELRNVGPLPQWWAASRISELFGDEFLRVRESGKWSIAPEVRALFTAMNPGVKYERWEWRMRDEWDEHK
jgi:hypothetical protein